MGEGHRKGDCPNPPKEREERKKGCFKCGEEGHNKADCPQGGDSGPMKCRRCGQEGHKVAECTERKNQSD